MRIVTTGPSPSPQLVTAGTLTKSGGTVVSTIGVPITASGPLSAASGTLDFISGGTLNTPAHPSAPPEVARRC